MTSKRRIVRREFLGNSLAGAGLLSCGTLGVNAESLGATSQESATAHFWYRLQPAGMYIDSQSKNRAFGYTDGTIALSEDNGLTWPHRSPFREPGRIVFSHVFENGTVVFATGAKLYRSADKLASYQEITVRGLDGSDYRPHMPQNPERAGWYFHTLPGVNSWHVAGAEMLVWGNYCNVLGGATPVNIYYSVDNGQTVKIAYAFGQNPHFSDNGSEGGGATGTLLGNPDNAVVCRHVHDVQYNPAEGAFYACTGDGDRGGLRECHWLRGVYDRTKDEWDWKVVVSGPSNSRYKAGGINFVDGQLYWIADANGPTPHDRGVFCCDPADLANPEKHTRLFNPEVESANMIIQDGVILASHCAPASPLGTGIIYSPDMGRTWLQYDLQEYGKRSPTRIQKKNSDGWFRMDLRSGWIQHAEVLFIKPKP